MDAELGVDSGQMSSHCPRAHEELARDLAIRHAGSGQLRDHPFLRLDVGAVARRSLRRLQPAGRELALAALERRQRTELDEPPARSAELVGGRAPLPLAAQELAVCELGECELVRKAKGIAALERVP